MFSVLILLAFGFGGLSVWYFFGFLNILWELAICLMALPFAIVMDVLYYRSRKVKHPDNNFYGLPLLNAVGFDKNGVPILGPDYDIRMKLRAKGLSGEDLENAVTDALRLEFQDYLKKYRAKLEKRVKNDMRALTQAVLMENWIRRLIKVRELPMPDEDKVREKIMREMGEP